MDRNVPYRTIYNSRRMRRVPNNHSITDDSLDLQCQHSNRNIEALYNHRYLPSQRSISVPNRKVCGVTPEKFKDEEFNYYHQVEEDKKNFASHQKDNAAFKMRNHKNFSYWNNADLEKYYNPSMIVLEIPEEPSTKDVAVQVDLNYKKNFNPLKSYPKKGVSYNSRKNSPNRTNEMHYNPYTSQKDCNIAGHFYQSSRHMYKQQYTDNCNEGYCIPSSRRKDFHETPNLRSRCHNGVEIEDFCNSDSFSEEKLYEVLQNMYPIIPIKKYDISFEDVHQDSSFYNEENSRHADYSCTGGYCEQCISNNENNIYFPDDKIECDHPRFHYISHGRKKGIKALNYFSNDETFQSHGEVTNFDKMKNSKKDQQIYNIKPYDESLVYPELHSRIDDLIVENNKSIRKSNKSNLLSNELNLETSKACNDMILRHSFENIDTYSSEETKEKSTDYNYLNVYKSPDQIQKCTKHDKNSRNMINIDFKKDRKNSQKVFEECYLETLQELYLSSPSDFKNKKSEKPFLLRNSNRKSKSEELLEDFIEIRNNEMLDDKMLFRSRGKISEKRTRYLPLLSSVHQDIDSISKDHNGNDQEKLPFNEEFTDTFDNDRNSINFLLTNEQKLNGIECNNGINNIESLSNCKKTENEVVAEKKYPLKRMGISQRINIEKYKQKEDSQKNKVAVTINPNKEIKTVLFTSSSSLKQVISKDLNAPSKSSEDLKSKGNACKCELDLKIQQNYSNSGYRHPPKYPLVRQDIYQKTNNVLKELKEVLKAKDKWNGN